MSIYYRRSFGETFTFLCNPLPLPDPLGWRWELSLQAAVFAIFDLDAKSKDLINADYWVGIPVSYRKGDFSAMRQVFHQSSHLGDEFLLRARPTRVNLSYEAAELLLSYELGGAVRLYGGPQYIFHKEPRDLKPWSAQYGVELRSPRTLAGGHLRPVAGADFKNRQKSG